MEDLHPGAMSIDGQKALAVIRVTHFFNSRLETKVRLDFTGVSG